MLRILFNRHSPLVRFVELIGLVNSFFLLRRLLPEVGLQGGFFLFLLGCYLFVRACSVIPWYRGKGRGIGIEVHFAKALVPTSYLLAVSSTALLLDVPILSTALLVAADLLILLPVGVNLILIGFTLRDRETVPVNYFSLNLYRAGPPAKKEAA